jgi:carboxyl-terminal processing protease
VRGWLACAAVAGAIAGCAPAGRGLRITAETPAAAGRPEQIAGEVVKTVRENFYDAPRGERWAAEHAGYAAGAGTPRAFAEATNAALAGLHASHTAYLTPADMQYYALLAVFQRSLGLAEVEYGSIGADYARIDGVWYVRRVFAGGPAEAAGLRRGDRIVAADGGEFEPIGSFGGRGRVELRIVREAGGAEERVSVAPRRVNPKEEWLAAQNAGTRVIEAGGRRIGYIPLYSGAGEEFQEAVAEAISGPLSGADALVLDLRDGYGGCNPDFVNMFNGAVPVLRSTDRSGKVTVMDGQWRRPLVVLVNGGSRSGKEVVAFAVKSGRLGTLVGERTAGAVLGGRPFLLSDRSLLYLATLDVEVDRVRLEGLGVEPDIRVPDNLPYAGGRDPQLEAAVARAAGG